MSIAGPGGNFLCPCDYTRLRRLGAATSWGIDVVVDGMGSDGRWGMGATSAKVERGLEEEVVPTAE